MIKLVILVASFAATAWGFSAGAPLSVCDDMLPKHPVDPQKSTMPYKITINKEEVGPGGEVEIKVGGKFFLGVLLQVRNEKNKAVGTFPIPGNDKYFKAIDCHGNKGSSATHKNKEPKKDITFIWQAPKTPGKYTVYATVAQDGGVFWVAKPSGTIKVA
ncbi:putative defense protein Hdd11 [Sitophilus oryzae]|uniref:Defense protein Hdd11 n=1 Tax=Sitophilus oryzae TaxID=7048 RepID=A0A6J2X6W3_SITOR|nr:putative defense protein Hdd11 [Sitophilus oryzae]